MTNLFSTRQLIRIHEPLQVDRILYARLNIVLTMFFALISAFVLTILLAIPDGSGWPYYIGAFVLLGIREYIKRRYTKYILGNSDDMPFIDILKLLRLRDRFGVSLIEQALMWASTAYLRSYLPILAMILVTVMRLAYQYNRLAKTDETAHPK
jgi:hypothetical protein